MTRFDTVAILDWSAANDRGPRPCRDAIWLGVHRNGRTTTRYLRNRVLAEDTITDLIATEIAAGRRLFLGIDFPFGYPAGFAHALTGGDDPRAVWAYLAQHLTDAPRRNDRFALAGRINARFPGIGPFWFNGTATDVPHLPRKDTRHGHGMTERRRAETEARGAFTCWQMGGAGAVGGQVFTGLPMLHRLSRMFGDRIGIWPFDAMDRDVQVVEVWPSLIADRIRAHEAPGDIRDEVQVRVLARAIAGLPPAALGAMMAIDAPEEGWIFGLGHQEALRAHA